MSNEHLLNYKFDAKTGVENPEFTFSLFKSIADENPVDVTLSEFAEMVAGGEWFNELQRTRAGQSQKKFLPAVSISGTFQGGHHKKDLINHSGLICLDFDSKDNPRLKDRLVEWQTEMMLCEFVKLAFVSASGQGLAVVCRIDPEKHIEAFDNLSAYFKQTHNLITDRSCVDVCRLRFVSWDENCEMKEARVFARYSLVEPRDKINAQEVLASMDPIGNERLEEIRSALAHVSPDNRDTWLQVGMAMKIESNTQEAYDLFDKWAQGTKRDNYNPDTNWSQWSSFGLSGSMTMASVFGLALENGWEYNEPVPADMVEKWMKCGPGVKQGPVVDMSFMDGRELLFSEIPPRERIIDGLLDRGDKMCIIAPPKCGKTWLSGQLMMSLVGGMDFLGFRIPVARRVLYVQMEVAGDRFKERMRLVYNGMDKPEIDYDFIRVFNGRGLMVDYDAINMAAVSFGAEVIIFDPVYKLVDGDENCVETWIPLLREFDKLCANASVVYVHHDSKSGSGREMHERGAGSNVVVRDYDVGIGMTWNTAQGSEEERVMDFEVRNYEAVPSFSVAWNNFCFVRTDSDVCKIANGGQPTGTKKKVDLVMVKEQVLGMVQRKAYKRVDLEHEVCGNFGISNRAFSEVVMRWIREQDGVHEDRVNLGRKPMYFVGPLKEVRKLINKMETNHLLEV